MNIDVHPWMILQDKVNVYDKLPAFVYCDRRQHLLILNFQANKHTQTYSTISVPDYPNLNNGRSTRTVEIQTVIYLERIQYIQRGGGVTSRRSAKNYNQLRSQYQNNQTDRFDPQGKLLEIYYTADSPRSEYLYKHICFQLKQREDEFDKWINALYAVIDEAKNLDETRRRKRWLLREYEKLRRSSKGLTFDSINGWLNSHIGLVGEKKNIERLIKENTIFKQSNEITDSVFISIYDYYYEKPQELLIKNLMSDVIEENRILLDKFVYRMKNNETGFLQQESDDVREFFRLDQTEREISLKQCITYLWSDANSAFDPLARKNIMARNMNEPLNHYWISSSHNTYLAKTQLFNPASTQCYIQALLKGCRCIEIDVQDSRPGPEPEVTHKNTRIKPIPLRDILEAIYDYAFVTSEYPIIISIENHCSAEQRYYMARMFIEIFGGKDYLLQSPLSPNEDHFPSPDKLKRKIILKDSKINSATIIESQTNVDTEDQLNVLSPNLQGHVQLFDFSKKKWLRYNYSFTDNDLFLATDDEEVTRRNSTEDSDSDSDDEEQQIKILPNDELTQISYHGNISHQEARSLLLSNAGYEIGTFLVRKSLNKNCYCITFLAFNSDVKSIEIRETNDENEKILYYLSQKKFESISDLICYYRTYDFAEVVDGSSKHVVYRLGRPLPRPTWRQELERQPWYQPTITREEAEELLLGLGEEMTFLIRESSSRARQDYAITVYTNGTARHSPIYRDGSDFMLMSKTFTSLVELVDYFSRKPIFQKLTLQKPAKSYAEFLNDRRRYEAEGINKNIMTSKSLESSLTLKVHTIRTLQVDEDPTDRTVKMQVWIYEENKKSRDGYFLKFEGLKDYNIFITKVCPSLSSSSINRSFDEISNISSTVEKTPTKALSNTSIPVQTQMCISEYNKLIIYCQGVKLKDLNINKTQDLLEKIRSFKEMISLNYVKAISFCLDVESMIQFNHKHFTRIYPDFSRRSWNSHNFEPHLYWLTGCQMVALNFQMPDRPMHINAGRFAANGSCGYVLMPNYIRSINNSKGKVEAKSMLLKIRVVAVRHLRTNQAKSILKVQIKTTLINKQRPAENPSHTSTINGPCGIWDSKQSSKHHDQLHTYNRFNCDDSDVDLLYFEVWTDNQEFCGQSAIPLSSLRTGIRSIQLYDKFNERLDMSALLVDIHFKAGISYYF